ncbi:MAG: hypothetical protein GEU96_02840 [Propionibacteriales bacterium]|nr:hypothetical protein [Propionibacteriales bacterium]
MSSMKLELSEMTNLANQLKSTHQDLLNQMDQMKSKVQATTDNEFITPSSSGAFNTSYEQFTTGTKTALDGMEGMATWLEGAVEGFTGLDDSLASQVAG